MHTLLSLFFCSKSIVENVLQKDFFLPVLIHQQCYHSLLFEREKKLVFGNSLSLSSFEINHEYLFINAAVQTALIFRADFSVLTVFQEIIS